MRWYISPCPGSESESPFTWQFDMHLYPSSSFAPWNTTFHNTEGQIIYKTEYLMRYGLHHLITIKRILPSNSTDLETGSESALRDSFTDFAEIHYDILSSRILFNGTEIATSLFFRKSGFLGRCELADCDCPQFLFNFSPRNLQTSGFYRSRRQRIWMGAEN
jgi:hypothetical protein